MCIRDRYNTTVEITSKIIEIGSRTSTVEIIMKNPNTGLVNAVLWTTVIFFNLTTRKTDVLPEHLQELFTKFFVEIPQKDFKERVTFLRNQNKNL